MEPHSFDDQPGESELTHTRRYRVLVHDAVPNHVDCGLCARVRLEYRALVGVKADRPGPRSVVGKVGLREIDDMLPVVG